MENIKMEDIVEKDSSTSEESETVETTEQDPLKTELEKVQTKTQRTELEKAAFSLKKNAERLKELGGDPNAVLGTEKETSETDEDDKPVTLGMLKRLQQETAEKTALQLAAEIPNETERELVKYHLQNTIKSTGNAQEDFKLARALVNSVKNSQIAEEVYRKTNPKNHSSSSGVDARQEEKIEFTQAELDMMKAPFNLSREEVIAARKGNKYNFNSL